MLVCSAAIRTRKKDGGNQRSEVSSCTGKPSSQEIIESRCQMSGVRRSGSFRPPFIFIDAADEEPQDHDYHIQQGPERGHHEHARAERGIEISEPAYGVKHLQPSQPAMQAGRSENQISV